MEPAPQRPLLAVVYGLLAAIVAVVAWWLASLGTKSELVYLAVAVGVAVGYFANIGARRGSATIAAIAVVLTFIGATAGYYLVSRASLIRRGYVRLPGEQPIPAMPSYTLVRDVLRVNLRGNVAPYLYFVVALVVAGLLGWRGLDPGGRRAEH
ncbi:MAG: hypothetical protein QM733_12625 [Ilumatobacteraceae bacterium]